MYRVSFSQVCYQKIEQLWKLINKQAEVESELQNIFFNTILSTIGLFSVPRTQKFCSEAIFLPEPTDVQMNC